MQKVQSARKVKKVEKAVALKYPIGLEAPFITTSVKGELAKKVVQIAKDNKIAIVENSELVNVLCVQDVGTSVPENLWPVLAKIFAFVMQDL